MIVRSIEQRLEKVELRFMSFLVRVQGRVLRSYRGETDVLFSFVLELPLKF